MIEYHYFIRTLRTQNLNPIFESSTFYKANFFVKLPVYILYTKIHNLIGFQIIIESKYYKKHKSEF